MDIVQTSRDQRRFPRTNFKHSVRLMPDGNEVGWRDLAQDLSEGGIRIRSNEFIGVGQAVAIGIQPSETSPIVEVPGQVVWVRFNPLSENYQLGVQFDLEAFTPLVKVAQILQGLN